MLAASLNQVKKLNAFIITTAQGKEIDAVELQGLKAFYTIILILYLYGLHIENTVHELSLATFPLKYSNERKTVSHHNFCKVPLSNMFKCIHTP